MSVLRTAGWRLMVSAKGVHRTEGFKYALDNGAWHSFVHKSAFDRAAFLEAYYKLGSGADFVVLPDIVAGGLDSLAFSLKWRNELTQLCPYLLAVQDGMEPSHVSPFVGPALGIFVGGTDKFKEETMPEWGQCARECNAYLHIGRVNSKRRIHLCEVAGAHSFDGSSVSRYAVTLNMLDHARKQQDLFTIS